MCSPAFTAFPAKVLGLKCVLHVSCVCFKWENDLYYAMENDHI